MINSLSQYTSKLIYVIVIIGVLSLILPNNKNKKYIKVVMGMYVMLVMISPIVGNKFVLSDETLEKYMNLTETSTSKASNDNDQNLKDAFKLKAKENIKTYLQSKGYECKSIEIEESNYNISKIKLGSITKNTKKDMINKVKINISEKTNESEISQEEQNQIKEILSSNYEISKEMIEIKE